MGQTIKSTLVYACILPVVLPLLTCIALVTKVFPRVRQLYLSIVWIRIGNYPVLTKTKEQLFSKLEFIKSKDPELFKINALRILELGIGEGTNLTYYPNNARLIAVEIIPKFEYVLRRRLLNKHPKLVLEKFIIGSATSLSDIQTESVDVVVCTHVFCHISYIDHSAVFKEIQRVLVEGGKFLFLEHVPHPTRSHYYVQKLVKPLWSLFFDCNLTNPFLQTLDEAKFKEVNIYRKDFQEEISFLFSQHTWGTASK